MVCGCHATIGPARRPSNSTLVAETVFALVRAALLLTSSPVDEPVYWAISESPLIDRYARPRCPPRGMTMPESTKPSNRRFRFVKEFPVMASIISASVYTARESAVRSVSRSKTWPEVLTQLAIKTRDERGSIPMESPRCWKVTETPAEWARPSFGTPRGRGTCARWHTVATCRVGWYCSRVQEEAVMWRMCLRNLREGVCVAYLPQSWEGRVEPLVSWGRSLL